MKLKKFYEIMYFSVITKVNLTETEIEFYIKEKLKVNQKLDSFTVEEDTLEGTENYMYTIIVNVFVD